MSESKFNCDRARSAFSRALAKKSMGDSIRGPEQDSRPARRMRREAEQALLILSIEARLNHHTTCMGETACQQVIQASRYGRSRSEQAE